MRQDNSRAAQSAFQIFLFGQRTLLLGMLYQRLPQNPQRCPASIRPFDFALLFGVQALELRTSDYIGLLQVSDSATRYHALLRSGAVGQLDLSLFAQLLLKNRVDPFPIGFGVMENSNGIS